MKLHELKSLRRQHPDSTPRFILPEGDPIPAHFHLPRGGSRGEAFAKILDLGKAVLPGEDLEVEVEYDCCVTAQYPLAEARLAGEHLDLQLGEKHTPIVSRRKIGGLTRVAQPAVFS